VTGHTDAPIRWPVGRATSGRGRPTIIAFGALVDAVRREAPSAVARAWGVRVNTVYQWRRALLTSGEQGRRRWTEPEDELVRALPPIEAAGRTGRTLKAVYSRRLVLGVHHPWLG
jgi:hypothetical protein